MVSADSYSIVCNRYNNYCPRLLLKDLVFLVFHSIIQFIICKCVAPINHIAILIITSINIRSKKNGPMQTDLLVICSPSVTLLVCVANRFIHSQFVSFFVCLYNVHVCCSFVNVHLHHCHCFSSLTSYLPAYFPYVPPPKLSRLSSLSIRSCI